MTTSNINININTTATTAITVIDTHFSTTAQINLDDIAQIAAQGFKTIINCRPDFEAGPDQIRSEELAERATELGLAYAHFPVNTGTAGDEFASDMAAFLIHTPMPALGFCRSGTRAGKLYNLAQTVNTPNISANISTNIIENTTVAIAINDTNITNNINLRRASFNLSVFEARVLGVLIEKRFLTPDTYPLSLNSLMLGCNQLTAREPTMSLSETAVKDTLDLLQERKLIAPRQQAGARVVKYEHRLYQHANLDDEMLAVLCVLLLRGAQTIGEIKQRTDRMVGFADLLSTQAAIARLGDLSVPYVMALAKAPGTKELRYVECLSNDEGRIYANSAANNINNINNMSDINIDNIDHINNISITASKGRLGELEDEVLRLKRDLESLTNAFLDFKKTFE